MKKIYLLAAFSAALFISVGLLGCNRAGCKGGSGKMITEERQAMAFTKLNVSGDFDVHIKQDSVSGVSITADDNLIQYIKTGVEGDELTVKSKDNICSSGRFVLNIRVRDVSAISTSGAVNLSSTGKLNTKDLELNFSGESKITLDINSGNLKTGGSGSTELNLTGQATSHTVDVSGSLTLNALNLVAGKYSIETSGDSKCKINVLNELNVSSSGSSDVEYRGNPTKIHEDKSGSSTLKKIE